MPSSVSNSLTPTKWIRVLGFLMVSWTASPNTVTLLLARMAVSPGLGLAPLCTAVCTSSAAWSHTPPAGDERSRVVTVSKPFYLDIRADLKVFFFTFLLSSH